MPDHLPADRPAVRRVDVTGADVGSLVAMGVLDEPPIPAPSIQPFLEPNFPPPEPDDAA